MSETLSVSLRTWPHFAGLELPDYQTMAASGMDLSAACPQETPIIVPPGETALVPTGLSMAIPAGYEGQIRPRSGLAAKFSLTCLNTPGTIDADYRGEVKVLLINHGRKSVTLQRGERVAQLVVAPVTRVEWVESPTLDATPRGDGGFGSTGW